MPGPQSRISKGEKFNVNGRRLNANGDVEYLMAWEKPNTLSPVPPSTQESIETIEVSEKVSKSLLNDSKTDEVPRSEEESESKCDHDNPESPADAESLMPTPRHDKPPKLEKECANPTPAKSSLGSKPPVQIPLRRKEDQKSEEPRERLSTNIHLLIELSDDSEVDEPDPKAVDSEGSDTAPLTRVPKVIPIKKGTLEPSVAHLTNEKPKRRESETSSSSFTTKSFYGKVKEEEVPLVMDVDDDDDVGEGDLVVVVGDEEAKVEVTEDDFCT